MRTFLLVLVGFDGCVSGVICSRCCSVSVNDVLAVAHEVGNYGCGCVANELSECSVFPALKVDSESSEFVSQRRRVNARVGSAAWE